MKDWTCEILLTKNIISDYTTALTLSADVADPCKMSALPVFLLCKTVLAVRECAVGHIHTIVTDLLCICYLVIAHSHFPVPVGSMDRLHGVLIKFKPPIKRIREAAWGIPVLAIPFDGYSHRKSVRLLRSELLSKLILRLTTHTALCTSHCSQMCITGAVREEVSAYADLCLLCSFYCSHSLDLFTIFLNLNYSVSGKESDVLFSEYDSHLLVILIVVGSTGISDSVRADFVQKVAERRIRIDIDLSTKAYSHLGRIVSAKDITVMDESYLASESRSSKSCTHTRDSSTDYNEVIMTFFFYRSWKKFRSERLVIFQSIAGSLVCSCDKDCVAASVKSHYIVKRNFMLTCRKLVSTAFLPVPCCALCSCCTIATDSEFSLIGNSVHLHLEDTGSLAF